MSKTIDIQLIGNDTNIEVGMGTPTSNTITVDFDTLPRTVSWESIVGKPDGKMFGGVITPTDEAPENIDENVYYIAFEEGVYENFGFFLEKGCIVYVTYDGSDWNVEIQTLAGGVQADGSLYGGEVISLDYVPLTINDHRYYYIARNAGRYSAFGVTCPSERYDYIIYWFFNKFYSDPLWPKGSYVYARLDGKQDAIEDLDAIREGASLGATALQSFTETDPTVPAWAKESTKPSYNYSEIGNTPDLSGFITKNVNDLANYYLKSETYTKTEVANLIAAINQFHYEIYTTLPASGESNVLYLIGPTGTGNDRYEEYVYSNDVFVRIGDTSIDLSGYVTTSALNTALANYTPTDSLTALLSGKVDKVDNAINGNFAGLDASGNVVDSGVKASDFATSDTTYSLSRTGENVSLNGSDSSSSSVSLKPLFGECSTGGTVQEKAVTIQGIASLTDGLMIHVKFDNYNRKANPTLNLNSLGAKPIYLYGSTAASTSAAASWQSGSVITLIYDGTNECWRMVDFNNTTYDKMTASELEAGTSTSSRVITAKVLADRLNELIPKATSDLNNDSGYIDHATEDLVHYYKKSETYSQAEVDDLVAAASDFAYEVVSSLPTASASTKGKFYIYNGHRYVTTGNDPYTWEDLGSYDIDLTGYVSEDDLEDALEDRPIFQLVTETQMQNMIDNESWEEGVIYYTVED